MPPLRVVIVGAGLGGLACAIACRRQGLDVLVLERAPEILPIGAGIQIPPNAARVLERLGLLDKAEQKGVVLESLNVRRYEDGRLIGVLPGGPAHLKHFGNPWIVLHRADYLDVLLGEVKRLDVPIRLKASVDMVNFEKTEVRLECGEVIAADVVVGADGLWSTMRAQLLDSPSPPVETGDLAYRGTFTRAQLEELHDPRVEELCNKKALTVWFGPSRHAVFYPLKSGQQFNLVLLRPDNLAEGVRTEQGDISEMRASFEGWDGLLTKIISCISSVLKWKLLHHDELRTWTKGNVALLGDSCHPTLPYQAQGAAMAVEDGVVLGQLLGSLQARLDEHKEREKETGTLIPSLLELYESLRKTRTTLNVKGAIANRMLYHMEDGEKQKKRDSVLANMNYDQKSEYSFADTQYQHDLLGFDCVGQSKEAFQEWWQEKHDRPMNGHT